MIRIENVDVYGWEAAIRGMRNPMNSWDKSDTVDGCDYGCCITCEEPEWRECHGVNSRILVGRNDFELMKKLAAAGADHGKFLRMINVTLDIVAPLYWLKEFDTYKVGTVANSCSTMHKLTEKEFVLDDFSHDQLMDDWSNMDDLVDYNGEYLNTPKEALECVIHALNFYRKKYMDAKLKPMKEESKRKEVMDRYWWQMIQLLPSSYNQRRTVQLNYQVLKAMYNARRNHKLDEWREFCKWIEALPYSELITGKECEQNGRQESDASGQGS